MRFFYFFEKEENATPKPKEEHSEEGISCVLGIPRLCFLHEYIGIRILPVTFSFGRRRYDGGGCSVFSDGFDNEFHHTIP